MGSGRGSSFDRRRRGREEHRHGRRRRHALDLFKIADLTRLDVLAHVFEEDLPMLEDLPATRRHWKIYLKSDPQGRPLSGSFSQIGSIIDPNQHTALVMGWVDNASGRLRIGQFITAAVDLPAYMDEVAVPASAIVDKDANSYVFVQPDAKANHSTRAARYGSSGAARTRFTSVRS